MKNSLEFIKNQEYYMNSLPFNASLISELGSRYSESSVSFFSRNDSVNVVIYTFN